jgi:hypothetical protein
MEDSADSNGAAGEYLCERLKVVSKTGSLDYY